MAGHRAGSKQRLSQKEYKGLSQEGHRRSTPWGAAWGEGFQSNKEDVAEEVILVQV